MAEMTTAQPQQPQGAGARAPGEETVRRALAVFSRSAGRLLRDERNQLNITAVNGFLYVVLALVVFNYIRLVLAWAQPVVPFAFGRGITASASKVLADMKDQQPLKDLGAYLEAVKARNILHMGRQIIQAEAVSTLAQEAVATLRLVGISWSQEPDAMIEDTKAQKTYFVKQGQLVGDMKVEEIRPNKVILRMGQELVELQ